MPTPEESLDDALELDIPEGVVCVANLMHREEGETYKQVLGLAILEYLRLQGILKGRTQEEIAEIRGTVRTFLEKLHVADENRLLREPVSSLSIDVLAGPGLEKSMEAMLLIGKSRVQEIAQAYQLDLLSEFLRLRLKLMETLTLKKSDALTGLYDRSGGAERVLELLKQNPTQKVVVIMLDLDHFKRVNDEHGHAAGDAVLKTRANQISHAVRPDDIVIRYGGEEFLVILRVEDIETGLEIANRLRAKFEEEPVLVDGQSISVTSSLGVAFGALSEVLKEKELYGDLVKAADEQLYRAKGERTVVDKIDGRNRVCIKGREPIRVPTNFTE